MPSFIWGVGEVGYFDIAAELKPLLHLWSLGAEEQYYLVWPLALFLLRGRPRQMLWMIVGLGAASFALNVALIAERPAAVFYLPVTRFWELLGGSLLAYLACYRPQPASFPNMKALCGAGLLAASIVALNWHRVFPGWWALLPVLGAMLLIWAGPSAWLNRTLLAHRWLVYVGLISYPLYLWHWPLLAYARIVERGDPPVIVRLAALAASFVLACLTFELVEKKIRYARFSRLSRLAVPALATSMTAVGLYGLLAMHSRIEPRSASIPLAREISSATSDWEQSRNQLIPGDSGKAVLFFGDSHMQHYLPRVRRVMAERTHPMRSVIFRTAGGCAPVAGIERKGQRCSVFVDEALNLAKQPHVEIVVIAASWVGLMNRGDYYKVGDAAETPLDLREPAAEWVFRGFQAALRQLVADGKQVILVLSSPRGPAFDPKSVVNRDRMTIEVQDRMIPVPRSKLSSLTAQIDDRLRRIAAAAGAAVIDPTDWLCGALDCPTADPHGKPLYKDDSHLRASVVRERFSALDGYVHLR